MSDDLTRPGDPSGADPTDGTEPPELSAADEVAVHDLLAALPDPEMPADVAERITGALAGATAAVPPSAATTVLPEAPGRRGATQPTAATAGPPSGRWRHPWLLQSAAVLVILGLVGAVAVGFVTRGNNDQQTASSGLAAAPDQTAGPVTVSGREYASGTLAGQVRGLLVGATAAVAPQEATAAGSSSSAVGSDTKGTNPPAAGLVELRALVESPAALHSCVSRLTDTPGVQPIAVDVGIYDGKWAAVVVLPDQTDPTKVEAWVVGSTCSDADNPFPYLYQRVTRP